MSGLPRLPSLIARVDQSTYLRYLALRDAFAPASAIASASSRPPDCGHYFVVTRWGMRREMTDLDQVDAFGRAVGVAS